MAILLIFAAWRDVASRLIPDSVPIVITLAGVMDRLIDGPVAAIVSIGAGAVLFGLLLMAHAKGAIGGGDVKLIAAIACGLKLSALYPFILATGLSGGALACLHLLLRVFLDHAPPRKPPAKGTNLLSRVLIAERWRIARRGPLPYAVAIACGGLVTIAGSFHQ